MRRLLKPKTKFLLIYSRPHCANSFAEQQISVVLNKLGKLLGEETRLLGTAEDDMDTKIESSREEGYKCAEVIFSIDAIAAPQTELPAVHVFSWSYLSAPDADKAASEFGAGKRNTVCFVALSPHSETTLRQLVDSSTKILCLPALSSAFAAKPDDTAYETPASVLDETPLDMNGHVLDSRSYSTDNRTHDLSGYGRIHEGFGVIRVPWNGEKFGIPCNNRNYGPQYLSGFYMAEEWGVWSESTTPSINLPYIVQGRLKVNIDAIGYGDNVGEEIGLHLGPQTATIVLQKERTTYSLIFDLTEPQDTIRFSGLKAVPAEKAKDTRTMGIGLISFFVGPSESDNTDEIIAASEGVQGVVYTAITDPMIAASNIKDLLTSFLIANQRRADATLILLIPPESGREGFAMLLELINACRPFSCRVLIVSGRYDSHNFERLKTLTSFYVDCSQSGNSHPAWLDFSMNGIPSIARFNRHRLEGSELIAGLEAQGGSEPFNVVCESGDVLHTSQFRYNWETLHRAMQCAYSIASQHEGLHKQLRKAAVATAMPYLKVRSGMRMRRWLGRAKASERP